MQEKKPDHAGRHETPAAKPSQPAKAKPRYLDDDDDETGAVTKGYELVRKLKESGTGEAKLAVCRKALMLNPGATASEIITALKTDGSVRQATIDKAEMIRLTGQWQNTEVNTATAAPIEERLAALDAAKGGLPDVPIEEFLQGMHPSVVRAASAGAIMASGLPTVNPNEPFDPSNKLLGPDGKPLDPAGNTESTSAGDMPPATGSHDHAAEIPTGQTVKTEDIGKGGTVQTPKPAETPAEKAAPKTADKPKK